jgi:hypothetical protein
MEDMEILTKKAGIIAPPSKTDTVEIDLGTGDPSKITFSEKIRISLRGSLPTCQVFRESWLSIDWILTPVQSWSSSVYDDSH